MAIIHIRSTSCVVVYLLQPLREHNMSFYLSVGVVLLWFVIFAVYIRREFALKGEHNAYTPFMFLATFFCPMLFMLTSGLLSDPQLSGSSPAPIEQRALTKTEKATQIMFMENDSCKKAAGMDTSKLMVCYRIMEAASLNLQARRLVSD